MDLERYAARTREIRRGHTGGVAEHSTPETIRTHLDSFRRAEHSTPETIRTHLDSFRRADRASLHVDEAIERGLRDGWVQIAVIDELPRLAA